MVNLHVKEVETDKSAFQEKMTALETENSQLMSENVLLKQKHEIEINELNHRIKNHLNLLMSTMRIEMDTSNNAELKESLRMYESRLYTLSTLYDFMGKTEVDNIVDTRIILEYYTDMLKDFYLKSLPEVQLNWQFVSRKISVHRMSKMTMIINEAFNNAMKHAFPDNKGEIEISLVPIGTKKLMLIICDDGIGCSKEIATNSKSIGHALIHSFAEDLDGELMITCTDAGGTVVKIVFPNVVE